MRALLQRLFPKLSSHSLLRCSSWTGLMGYGLLLILTVMLDDPTIEAPTTNDPCHITYSSVAALIVTSLVFSLTLVLCRSRSDLPLALALALALDQEGFSAVAFPH